MNGFETLMQRLLMLKGMGQAQPGGAMPPVSAPAAPVMPGQMGGRGDIALPPESGQIAPNLPMAHLPDLQRQMLLQQMLTNADKRPIT